MKKSALRIVEPTPKVVRKVQPFSLPIDQLDSYHGRKKIAEMLRAWYLQEPRKAFTWKNFARKVSLSPRTVSRIASEDTKSPQLHTILMIMRGLGFSLVRFEAD